VQHNHVHLQVDAALMEQLRAGYAQLSARRTADGLKAAEMLAKM
jgi:hypothetical protein